MPTDTVVTEVAQETASVVATELLAVLVQLALMAVAVVIASAAAKELQLVEDGDIYDGMLSYLRTASRHNRVFVDFREMLVTNLIKRVVTVTF